MKKTVNTLKSLGLLAIVLLVTIACDKDFANIDSDIQGVRNFNASSVKFPLVTYTKTVSPFTASGNQDFNGVQSNGLPNNLLGVYKDPNNIQFGTTTASVITQILPVSFNPDFGENANIESVILRIPYYSTLTDTNSEGDNFYRIDSLYGDITKAMKLSIYQSNYLLRALDPDTNFEENQAYYSNQKELFDSQVGPLLYESTQFRPDPDEFLVFDSDGEISERLVPALRIDLTNIQAVSNYWQSLIIDNQETGIFDNRNSFTEFFRGLYFNIDFSDPSNEGSQVVLDFLNSAANLTIEYSNDDTEAGDEFNTYVFNFNGIRANTLETTGVSVDLNGNPNSGDNNLYLKGGDGTMAVVDLFNGDVVNDEGINQDALTFFNSKKEKWLVNEANLIFYVDQSLVANDEPERLLLFDLKNNVPIIDYFLDGTTNTTNPNQSKTLHAEILERDSNNKGIKYKFRLTNHINNMLLRDSTNVKLGLFVASNVNITQNAKIQNPNLMDDTILTEIPASSFIAPKGTVLHGSLPAIPDGQRAEFEIFFTEPNNN